MIFYNKFTTKVYFLRKIWLLIITYTMFVIFQLFSSLIFTLFFPSSLKVIIRFRWLCFDFPLFLPLSTSSCDRERGCDQNNIIPKNGKFSLPRNTYIHHSDWEFTLWEPHVPILILTCNKFPMLFLTRLLIKITFVQLLSHLGKFQGKFGRNLNFLLNYVQFLQGSFLTSSFYFENDLKYFWSTSNNFEIF